MKNNIFTVAEVPGSKRTSPRNYTHAVIGIYNWNQRLANDDKDMEHDATEWDYMSKVVGLGIGGTYKSGTGTMVLTVDEKQYNRYFPIVNEFPTRELYRAHCRANRVAFVKTKMAQPEVVEVLRWSQSYVNACKGHGEFSSYKSLRVVPTIKTN